MRLDSLHERLTQPQRHDLMLHITEFGQGVILKSPDNDAPKDRFEAGLSLCQSWGLKTSRTAVHDFFKRYNFGWRLELGAWAAKHTEQMPAYEKETRLLTAQKLFAEISDADCPPKLLVLVRSLQLEQDKIDQRERLAENRGKLEAQKLKLADRRVKLLEGKIESARKAISKATTKGGLTPEVLKQIEEKLNL